MEEVPVTVSILDRKYKLKIARNEEEFLRKAAELIDTQARSYGRMYAYKDHQDLLAMVALTQITQLTRMQDGLRFKDTDLEERLTNINNILTQAVDGKGKNRDNDLGL